MNTVEQILLSREVPLHNIHTERFDIDVAGQIGKRQVYPRHVGMALGVVMMTIVVLFAARLPLAH